MIIFSCLFFQRECGRNVSLRAERNYNMERTNPPSTLIDAPFVAAANGLQ